MSVKHLLNPEGAVVCGADPRPDGSNTASWWGLVTCRDCLGPRPSDREVLEQARKALRDYVNAAAEETHVGPYSVLTMIDKHLRREP